MPFFICNKHNLNEPENNSFTLGYFDAYILQDEDITYNATDAVCCINLFKISKYLFFSIF